MSSLTVLKKDKCFYKMYLEESVSVQNWGIFKINASFYQNVIEHNLHVIKNPDWIIDLGPEVGNLGGNVIVQGTVTDLIEVDKSYTVRALKRI